MVGAFGGTASFGRPDDPNRLEITSDGEKDIFIAQYAPNGSLNWVQQAGGTGSDLGFSVAVDINFTTPDEGARNFICIFMAS